MAENHGSHHVTPLGDYIKVAAALFGLTFLTMIAFWMHSYLGPLGAPIAFLIAAIKAALVMMYFMHMKYDSWENRIVFLSGFLFLALLFIFSAGDIWTRVIEASSL